MRKSFMVLLAGIIAAAFITGCGKSSGPAKTDTGTQQGGSGGTGEDNTEETQGNQAQGTSKLIISTWESQGGIVYFDRLMEEFKKAYPQYEVEIIYTDALQYNDKIITLMAGGTECDVVFFKDAASLSGCVEKGQITPLNEYLDSSSLDKDRYSGLIDALSRDGSVYGMPYRKDNTLIYYNKDMFDEKGVEYPKDGMTLEEFRQTAAKFAGGTGTEKTYGAAEITWGSLYTVMATRTGKFTISNPESYDALKDYYNTFLTMQDEDKSLASFAELVATGDYGQWTRGQAAMTWLGTWFTNQIIPSGLSPVDFNWGVCSLPNNAGVKNENGVGSVTPVSISKYTQNPQAAWDFIEFACGPEGAGILAEDAILSGYTDASTVDVISQVEGVPEGYGNYLKTDTFYLETEMKPHTGELGTLTDQQNSLIMTGSAPVDDAIAEYKKMAEDILSE